MSTTEPLPVLTLDRKFDEPLSDGHTLLARIVRNACHPSYVRQLLLVGATLSEDIVLNALNTSEIFDIMVELRPYSVRAVITRLWNYEGELKAALQSSTDLLLFIQRSLNNGVIPTQEHLKIFLLLCARQVPSRFFAVFDLLNRESFNWKGKNIGET